MQSYKLLYCQVFHDHARCAYKSKLQVSVVTSTEVELYTSIDAAKIGKYLRSILDELGFIQDSPTMLHEDNHVVKNIANNSQRNSLTRHVSIQTFTIQEGREDKELSSDQSSSVSSPASIAPRRTSNGKVGSVTIHSPHRTVQNIIS